MIVPKLMQSGPMQLSNCSVASNYFCQVAGLLYSPGWTNTIALVEMERPQVMYAHLESSTHAAADGAETLLRAPEVVPIAWAIEPQAHREKSSAYHIQKSPPPHAQVNQRQRINAADTLTATRYKL